MCSYLPYLLVYYLFLEEWELYESTDTICLVHYCIFIACVAPGM